MAGRMVTSRYDDPLAVVWIAAAERIGITITRTQDAYASYDGAGTLAIAVDEALDSDDHLGQMIFHELCHALIQGEGALQRPDWGLENVDESTLVEEHACDRLQAYWAGQVGLREFLAVTTDHRSYYDALPSDPLAPGSDPAIALAREGLLTAKRLGWAAVIEDALSATAIIGRALLPYAPAESLWGSVRALHPVGAFPLGDAEGSCGTCAWAFKGGPGPAVWRCRQTKESSPGPAARIAPQWPPCERYEAPLDATSCAPCGACCHRGFHLVPVGAQEPVVRRHPALIVRDGRRMHIPRPHGRCVALEGDGTVGYRCQIYALRPRHCAELEIAGDACLTARRRVGLSR